MSAPQRSFFDPDFIAPPTEWDGNLARSVERDITRNYHGGDHQSNLAHQSIEPKKTAMQRQIHAFVTACGRRGATCHEAVKATGLKWQTASARLSEMKRPGSAFPIFWNGEKRATDGSRPGRAFVTSEASGKR